MYLPAGPQGPAADLHGEKSADSITKKRAFPARTKSILRLKLPPLTAGADETSSASHQADF